ncbi:MAG TPA: methyltransferase domain-containing protein [Pseudolabrys sp.]|jgi:SAM-dependent methyltransferase|nr:methyltransferase domain-containing protein [Pseudolabrys sp.]
MSTLDTASTTPALPDAGTVPSLVPGAPIALRDALDGFGIDNHERWAWANYERVVAGLCSAFDAHRILEIGGGRDPLFSRDEIKRLGVEMTVNDISPGELSVLPSGYRTACFDIAGDISAVADLRNGFDLAFSRMVFEHVADGRRAWANLYELLAPGGIALAFMPTLYALPFVANWLLPDKIAAAIVKRLFANRTDDEDPVFPARYSWCVASERRMHPMLSEIGYREIAVLPFYGHGYYGSFPIVRDLHARFTDIVRRRDWRLLASHAYIVVRK